VFGLPPPRQAAQHPFPLAPFAEPRIEPEIVFGLAAAPSPDMDEAALLDCAVNSPLATGDIVTTGTLTRAFPIMPGESWSTTLHGIELAGRPVWFA
jgi:2-keto-4-pentenoate hydratase